MSEMPNSSTLITGGLLSYSRNFCFKRRMRLDAGHKSDCDWLANSIFCFVRIFMRKIESADIDYSDQNVLSILQPAIVAVQSAIDKFEGAVARLLADDKGTRFKIAFGMPSCQHEGTRVTNYVSSLVVRF